MGRDAAVVTAAWQALGDELARWRDAGRAPDFWWRDDDAGRVSPALARLLALARTSGIPLGLAVVPANAEPALLARLDAGVRVLQHGTDHVNRAAAGEKKTEFPAAEPAHTALARLTLARASLQTGARARYLPVFVPPWNRFKKDLIPDLAAAGYGGLSQYGARKKAEPYPGLKQVNTHVDIIAWQGNRGFVGETEALLATVRHLSGRRSGTLDAAEPTGLLTHHALHDAAAWAFLEHLFAITREAGARWREIAELFR